MDMRRIIVIVAVLSLAGCATKAGYGKVMQTWQGSTKDQVINKWGYPQTRYTTPIGNEVFEYVWKSSHQRPMMFNTVGNTTYGFGGDTIVNGCRTVFEFGMYGYVDRVSWNGNSCKAK